MVLDQKPEKDKTNKPVDDQTPKDTKKMLLNYFKCANISLEEGVIFVKGSVLAVEGKVSRHLPCCGRSENNLSVTYF